VWAVLDRIKAMHATSPLTCYVTLLSRYILQQVICDDGKNQVPEVWAVLDRIKVFSEKVRSGEWKGATGKPIKNIVAIGIGGSFLGPLFVHTSLRYVLPAMMGRALAVLHYAVRCHAALRCCHGCMCIHGSCQDRNGQMRP
jgi:hypothetical protein